MTLILGNITFNNFTERELKLFSNPEKESKALINEIDYIIDCSSREQAEQAGDDYADSYVIPEIFTKHGEIAYDCDDNVEVVKFRDWINSLSIYPEI